jgi:hypothetical protein
LKQDVEHHFICWNNSKTTDRRFFAAGPIESERERENGRKNEREREKGRVRERESKRERERDGPITYRHLIEISYKPCSILLLTLNCKM